MCCLAFQQEEIIWAEIIVRLVVSTVRCVYVLCWGGWILASTDAGDGLKENKETGGSFTVKHRKIVSLTETEKNK